MRRAGILTLCLLACSPEPVDTAVSRLRPGDALTVVGDPGESVFIHAGGNATPIALGASVRCEADDEVESFLPETKDSPRINLRMCGVVVVDGEARGAIGKIYRSHLRPEVK